MVREMARRGPRLCADGGRFSDETAMEECDQEAGGPANSLRPGCTPRKPPASGCEPQTKRLLQARTPVAQDWGRTMEGINQLVQANSRKACGNPGENNSNRARRAEWRFELPFLPLNTHPSSAVAIAHCPAWPPGGRQAVQYCTERKNFRQRPSRSRSAAMNTARIGHPGYSPISALRRRHSPPGEKRFVTQCQARASLLA